MPEELDEFLKLRPRLDEVREDAGQLRAQLHFARTDDDVAELLFRLRESGVIREIRLNEKLLFPPDLPEGRLDLIVDLGNLPGYFETYDLLIEKFPTGCPHQYFVCQKAEGDVAGYDATCAFLNLIRGKAEVWDETLQRFYLVDQQAVEIPLAYHVRQTTALVPLVDGIKRFLHDDHLDADARWAFFRKAMVRLTRDAPSVKRLGVLLENIPNILDRAQRDYSLYLERFSFEDLLKNFDENRLKFVNDLHQVVSSIQTSLIAVPIAFFLVAEKFQPAATLTAKNAILAFGGIIFFGLLLVLSFNQGRTLNSIRLALLAFEAEQTKRQTERFENLKSLLDATWEHYNRVWWFLWTVRVLLIAFAAVVTFAAAWSASPGLRQIIP